MPDTGVQVGMKNGIRPLEHASIRERLGGLLKGYSCVDA
jgi:hypothetical protein